MPTRYELRELSQEIADHQMALVRLGEAWGQRIVYHLTDADKLTLAYIREELQDLKLNLNTAKAEQKLDSIRTRISKIRMKAFVAAEKELRAEAPELIDNESKWSKHLLAELQGEEITAFKDITEAKAQRILSHSVQINKTWDQWWTKTAAADVDRIANIVCGGLTQGMTIDQMIQLIGGTKAAKYTDGVLSTTRSHARNLARTLSCGIANQAKDAFYRENDDVVIGVEWLSTLDGRTCRTCGGLDRQRYKPDEPHPVPPAHPSCRCVLIPVTELTDLGEDVGRSRANADFDAEAKRMYEEKYPDKNYDDLAYSTRQKYYYDAIKRYEEETGKPAFTFGNGSMSFSEYFEKMDAQQKRDYLGPGAYAIYKRGNLDTSKFIPPYPNRAYTVAELRRMDEIAAARRIQKN